MKPLNVVGDVQVSAIFLTAMFVIVLYHWTTGGKWKNYQVSRHLMGFTAAIALIAGLGFARAVSVDLLHQSDPAWFQWLRVSVLAFELAAMIWRAKIVWDAAFHNTAGPTSATLPTDPHHADPEPN